jgi:hypothetical protein
MSIGTPWRVHWLLMMTWSFIWSHAAHLPWFAATALRPESRAATNSPTSAGHLQHKRLAANTHRSEMCKVMYLCPICVLDLFPFVADFKIRTYRCRISRAVYDLHKCQMGNRIQATRFGSVLLSFRSASHRQLRYTLGAAGNKYMGRSILSKNTAKINSDSLTLQKHKRKKLYTKWSGRIRRV